MKRKLVSMLLVVMVLIVSIPKYSFAAESGKVIFINMNRTTLESMQDIHSLKTELEKRGYMGLMNIRGDQGTDDNRSLASMGAGGRVNLASDSYINFKEATKENTIIYKAVTGQSSKKINDLAINQSLNENEAKGQYGSTLGSLGQTLSDNNFKVAVLGNSDTVENDEVKENRNICLIAMDNYGRVEDGNIDDINIEDDTMPFGIRTDYDKLTKETKALYENNDALFVDLGDTYRLDQYKGYLNEKTYSKMKKTIYNNISQYLKSVFDMVGENDVVYIASSFPSKLAYKNKERLSPIVKFKGNKKGLLSSSTTRRDGIVANIDVGVDILNEFGLKNEAMVGRAYSLIQQDDNLDFLSHELEKMATVSSIRANVVNTFVGVVSVSWVIGMVAILFRNRIPNKEKVFGVLKEFIKLGIIMPLVFLLAPIFNFKTPVSMTIGIIITTLVLYLLGRLLFKDDLKQMGFFALVTIVVIVVDCMSGSYLMKNSIMSYDAIVGARYYGVGNEYEGVSIASPIFAFAILLNYNKKLPKWSIVIASILILITSAYPTMGANVGGAISQTAAYLLFIMLIFDIKLDFKKVILICISVVGVVGIFAFLDIVSGSESHLGLFVQQILLNGPSTIIQTFARKISMNVKLAQTSVWVNILLAGIFIIGIFIIKPPKQIRMIAKRYPMIFKGFIASMIGCMVTLLVNDSGIVAASTASIYVLIPLIIISINMLVLENKEND
ncbi:MULTISPECIES: hypothetical protein [Romboutsia]|uniref:hypothetical protein n=1 Tax=Romboutsia TaxID=1501226 RepID=UPI00217058BE|nr:MULTISPECIES: hypothetical protein [Romboutsia]MCI9259140.1 hypothetical protein [Romboutsia sp.]